MPKLPAAQQSSYSQLLEKESLDRGATAPPKPSWTPKLPGKKFSLVHLRIVFAVVALVIVLVLIYAGVTKFAPNIGKIGESETSKEPEYPINVEAITFPSDTLKAKFLENFRLASVEGDEQAKYRLYEENFAMLRGFYTAKSDFALREQLEAYKKYIASTFPTQFEENKKVYEIVCLDTQCAEVVYEEDIKKIRDSLIALSTVDAQLKEAILKNIDAAALSSDENRVNYYLSAYSMLVSAAKQTDDQGVKDVALSMQSYVQSKYPDLVIPEEMKI